MEEMGLDPLLGSLASSAITGAIAGAVSKDHDIFKGVYDTYTKSLAGLMTLGGLNPSNSYDQAAYLAKLIDFSDIVAERGLVDAVETYATGIFNRQAVENMVSIAGSVGAYISKLFEEGVSEEAGVTPGGEKLMYRYLADHPELKLSFNESGTKFLGYSTSDIEMLWDDFKLSDYCGIPIFIDASFTCNYSDGTKFVTRYDNNGNMWEIEIYNSDSNEIGYYEPNVGNSSIIMDSSGNIISGKFVSSMADYSLSVINDQIAGVSLKRDCVFNETQIVDLLNVGLAEEDLVGFKEVVSIVDGVLKYTILPPSMWPYGTNEAANEVLSGVLETEGRLLWEGIWNLASVATPADPKPVAIYDDSGKYANIDLNVNWPLQKPMQTAIDLLSILHGDVFGLCDDTGSLITSQSRLQTNTNLAAQLRAELTSNGAKFIIDCGDYVDGLSKEQLPQFYNNLSTNKIVHVGFSFGSVDQVKEWLIPNSVIAEHTILISPQLPPEILEKAMVERGIDPSTVTIIDIQGDLPPALTIIDATNGYPAPATNWTDSYANNMRDGKLRWNYVKLQSGGNLSWWNMAANHGAAIKGILNNVIYDKIKVNDSIKYGKTLNFVLNELIEPSED